MQQDYKICAIHCLHARYNPAEAALAHACLATESFGWNGFLQFIRRERISPLIFDTIGNWDVLPPEVALQIQKDYLTNIWVNSQRIEELRRAVNLLAHAGIPSILLKGAALMCTLYEKRGLRPMSDMDILVPAADFNHARQELADNAYELNICYDPPAGSVTQVPYQKIGQGQVSIDLHCSLFNPPHDLITEQLDWFWAHREVVEMDGVDIGILNPSAQLLHLCAHHWLHHGGGYLLWEYDLDLLLRRYYDRIDWDEILLVAEKFDLLLPLQRALSELARVWLTPLPAEFFSRLGCLNPSKREKRKFGLLWGNEQSYLKTLLGGMISYPKWSDRLRYAQMIILPPKQYIMGRYQVRNPLAVSYFYMYRILARLFQQRDRLLTILQIK